MFVDVDYGNGVSKQVSQQTPMPTSSVSGGSTLASILLKQNAFMAHGVSSAAAAGNFSKIQIWNPSNSGRVLVLYFANMWHTSGTVIYKASLDSNVLSANESSTVKQNMMKGSAKTSLMKIYTKNTDATSATDVVSQISSTSTSANGVNVSPLVQMVCMPNSGATIESTTANMAINGVFVWAEVDLGDLPSIT